LEVIGLPLMLFGKMSNITIQMQNHSMMAVVCDPSVRAELKEYFSFYVPGYKFIPSYRRKQWDGKIRLFNPITCELNVGLYAKLCRFAADRHYHMQMEHSPYGLPNATNKVDHQKLVSSQALWKMPFPPRDYQYDAITHGIQRKRAVLLSPTGSGKSFIIYNLMRWYLENNDKSVLIVVPTTSLVEQMYKDFKDYGFDAENECHIIYSGKDKKTDKRIVITTWQSVYRLGKDWFDVFGCVFGDECHLFKAKSLTTLMNKCTEAEYRFGTTGTLDGSQVHKLVLEGLFGPTKRVTFTRDLQDKGTLAKLKIDMLLLDYSEETRIMNKELTYQEEVDFLVTYEPRNKFIRNLAVTQKGNTLVLFQFVEKHGEILHKMIKEVQSDKVYYVHGGTDTSDREAIRGIVEKQDGAIIVASLGTFSTGINIRNLHNIIFASPSKSQVKVLQSIGRGLRKADNGQDTKLYDLSDDMQYHSRQNFTLKHAGERIKMYTKEKFDFELHKVVL
jgi:superfamily II DNA or RNA helicase